MTDQSGTGKVYSSRGKVTAAEIITGMKLEGAVDEAVFRAALETMKHLQTGSVSGAAGVEATG